MAENLGKELSEKQGDFLHWIHSRLHYVYKDKANLDFMVRLKKVAEEFDKKEEKHMDMVKVVYPPKPNIKAYSIKVSVYALGGLTDIKTTFFKTDYPSPVFWEKVMDMGRKWGKCERVVSLMDEEDNVLESCTIKPKAN